VPSNDFHLLLVAFIGPVLFLVLFEPVEVAPLHAAIAIVVAEFVA